MTETANPIDFLWFIPTSGDGTYLGSTDLNRGPEIGYLTQIAQAVDRLGYSGVLLPTGVSCEESFITAAALSAHTQKLKFHIPVSSFTLKHTRVADFLYRVVVSFGRQRNPPWSKLKTRTENEDDKTSKIQ